GDDSVAALVRDAARGGPRRDRGDADPLYERGLLVDARARDERRARGAPPDRQKHREPRRVRPDRGGESAGIDDARRLPPNQRAHHRRAATDRADGPLLVTAEMPARRPRSNRATRVHNAATSSSDCVATMIAAPRSRASPIHSTKRLRAAES